VSKFKIEKGVSRITRVKLQVAIEESIAADVVLLSEWSNNEKNYVVNELLRFALAQDMEFQRYKESIGKGHSEDAGHPETANDSRLAKRIARLVDSTAQPPVNARNKE